MLLVIQRYEKGIGNVRVYSMACVSISFAQRMCHKPCCETWILAEQRFQPVRLTVQEASRALNGTLSCCFIQRCKANEGWRPRLLATRLDQEIPSSAAQSTPIRNVTINDTLWINLLIPLWKGGKAAKLRSQDHG